MDQSEAHQHVDGPGNRVAPPAHGIRYLFSHIYISIFKTVLKFLRAISRERELPFRMEFSSVQNLCLHVSFVFSSSQRIVHFFFIFFFVFWFSLRNKNSLNSFFLRFCDWFCWADVKLRIQLISSAYQRCRLSEQICRLSVILTRSSSSSLRISSNAPNSYYYHFLISNF